MKEKILRSVQDSVAAVMQLTQPEELIFLENAAKMLVDCFDRGGKVLIAGNGGSMCDATHFAEELTGIFRTFRQALPALALGDSGHITCVANDLGFEWIFARAIEAFGRPEDIFIGLTTSGNSPNLVKAFEIAKNQGLGTIALLGKNGGRLKGMADLELIIRGTGTSDRIQESHMTALHIIIELIEQHLEPQTPNYIDLCQSEKTTGKRLSTIRQ